MLKNRDVFQLSLCSAHCALFPGRQNVRIGDCAGLTAGGLSLAEENTEAVGGDQ
jgi:hypothetical protein